MKAAFEVEFLEEVVIFLRGLNQKEREKIIYTIDKSRFHNDSNLLKKLTVNIWEFRTIYNSKCFRVFAFWYNTPYSKKIIVATHGIIKKSNKTPSREIQKAEKIREIYFRQAEHK